MPIPHYKMCLLVSKMPILHLYNDIFNFFYKPRVSHGAIAVQPLQGWQYKTPTGFNRNSPAL